MVVWDTRCQEPGAWVEPKGLLVALHYREVGAAISLTRRLARYACFFLARVENVTNRQTHRGGWVENVTNGQTNIGGWVENVVNGRTNKKRGHTHIYGSHLPGGILFQKLSFFFKV